jgi:methyl-accepting chemotaxis protein
MAMPGYDAAELAPQAIQVRALPQQQTFPMNITSETPRSSSEEAARTAALLAALEHVQAVIEFDLDGRVLQANSLFLDLMGYSAEEVVGQHHRIFCPTEVTNSESYGAFWKGLRQGEVREDEIAP